MEEEPEYEEQEEMEEEPLASPATLPVTLKVELGKIELTADKLLALSPGNLLELATHPNDPIYLTLNGKRVAKGELMMMGETLGIRLLELGK
ncbi:MAG: FliM/FliN family flagellar motor switch protein [Parachlamydiales bacterium]